MKSYDYARRRGVLRLSWDDFAALAARLTEQVAQVQPAAVVGIARAGLFPATALACSLRVDLYPVRLTRRQNDEVVYSTPQWVIPVPAQVAGKTVIVVDEIADSGETLAIAAAEVRAKGADRVVTGALITHSWANPAPDTTALVTDALVIFPWDQQVYTGGSWHLHPEIEAALGAQSRGQEGDL